MATSLPPKSDDIISERTLMTQTLIRKLPIPISYYVYPSVGLKVGAIGFNSGLVVALYDHILAYYLELYFSLMHKVEGEEGSKLILVVMCGNSKTLLSCAKSKPTYT